MQFIEKIKSIFKDALTSGWSAHKLTQSFCVGIFIAFFPIPGSHTVMMFLFKWLLNLNFPILFISTSFNNPWTMIPFFTFDYVFGYWFTHNFLGWSPGWTISLHKIFGSGEICIWSFFIGGNILGIFAAFIFYPIVNFMFKKLVSRFQLAE
jgi:uncharacterized protein (DUF2062 family)